MAKWLTLLLVAAAPAAALAQGAAPQGQAPGAYGSVKVGAVIPQHKDLEGLDTGYSLEGALGYRLSPNLALEGGIGYFRMSGSQSAAGPTGPMTVEAEWSAVPLTASLKAIAPLEGLDLFLVAGGGVYFTTLRGTVSIPGQSATVSDKSNAFAFHLGGGAAARVSARATLGAEVRYLFGKATLFDSTGHFDSVLIQAVLGAAF